MPRHFVFPKNHSDSQNYYYFSDGISTDELKRLFNDVALIPEHRATTVASDDSAIRSSIVKWIPQNDQWSWLYDKMINMATIANNALWNFDLQTAFAIQTQIKNTINNFEPRVQLRSVNVSPDFDAHEFNVTITYNIVGIEADTQQLQFALEPTR